jgi:DNA-directed RNA polymerase specialized sigma24 family protein
MTRARSRREPDSDQLLEKLLRSVTGSAEDQLDEARAAAKAAASEVAWRDQLIVQARRRGWSYQRIADACGVSRNKVRRICVEHGQH